MLDNFLVAFHQVVEASSQGGLKEIFRQRVFWKRIATPTVMDLTAIDPSREIPIESGFQFVELCLDEILAGKWCFAVPSRRYKAPRNLKRGLRCFALVRDLLVVGDVWCVAPKDEGRIVTHTDLDMLGINCKAGDAYAFDMLIDPKFRGKNLAIPIHNCLQSTLKVEGCKSVYGFYWNDNLPALWMHRMLKFKELPKRWVSRFFS